MAEIPLPKLVHKLTYDGATLNIFHAKKGQGLAKHHHDFSHATFCCAGSVVVRKEGKEVVVDKHSKPLNLLALEWHEIEALEDETVFVNMFAEGKY